MKKQLLMLGLLAQSLTGCGDISQIPGLLQQLRPGQGIQITINAHLSIGQVDVQNHQIDVEVAPQQTRRLVLKSDRLKQAVQSGQIRPGSSLRINNNKNLEIIGADELFEIDEVEIEGLEDLIIELRRKEEGSA